MTNQTFQDGFNEGKTQSIEVLERVLASMKSGNSDITSIVFNNILDELLSKVLDELT